MICFFLKDDISSYSKNAKHYQRYHLYYFLTTSWTDISPHDLSVHLFIHPSIPLTSSLPSFISSSFFLSFLPCSPSFHAFIHPYIHQFTHLSIVHLPLLPSCFLSITLCLFSPACHPPSIHLVHSLFPVSILCFHPSICSTYSGLYVPGPCSGCWPPSDKEDKRVGFWEAECDWRHCDLGQARYLGQGAQVS